MAANIVTLPTVTIELTTDVQIQTVEAHEVAMDTATQPRERLANVEEVVRSYFKDVPVMIDVAWCESRFTQIDPATGEVFRGYMNPQDVGVMQINEGYHLRTAQAMGLDLTDLKDNLAYARHLYEEQGTRPWNASRACWQGGEIALK